MLALAVMLTVVLAVTLVLIDVVTLVLVMVAMALVAFRDPSCSRAQYFEMIRRLGASSMKFCFPDVFVP